MNFGCGGFGMMNFGCGSGMMLLAVLFWVAVLVGVVLLVRALSAEPRRGDGGRRRERDPALEIARERFAEGEIDQEEFECIKRGLS